MKLNLTDFCYGQTEGDDIWLTPIAALEFANKAIEKRLAAAPTVYTSSKNPTNLDWSEWWMQSSQHDTHTAKLVDIREIEKK